MIGVLLAVIVIGMVMLVMMIVLGQVCSCHRDPSTTEWMLLLALRTLLLQYKTYWPWRQDPRACVLVVVLVVVLHYCYCCIVVVVEWPVGCTFSIPNKIASLGTVVDRQC